MLILTKNSITVNFLSISCQDLYDVGDSGLMPDKCPSIPQFQLSGIIEEHGDSTENNFHETSELKYSF